MPGTRWQPPMWLFPPSLSPANEVAGSGWYASYWNAVFYWIILVQNYLLVVTHYKRNPVYTKRWCEDDLNSIKLDQQNWKLFTKDKCLVKSTDLQRYLNCGKDNYWIFGNRMFGKQFQSAFYLNRNLPQHLGYENNHLFDFQQKWRHDDNITGWLVTRRHVTTSSNSINPDFCVLKFDLKNVR